jgi:hypothetical protein
MPPHTRASMISCSASEKRSKLRGGQGAEEHLLLSAVKATLSVPKKVFFLSFWLLECNSEPVETYSDSCFARSIVTA